MILFRSAGQGMRMIRTEQTIFERRVIPYLVDTACALNVITRQRQRIVPAAEGVVLEVGIGSGHNLRHYDRSRVRRIIGVDPNPGLLQIAAKRHKRSELPLELLEETAERMSLEDARADTAVITYTACSIPDVEAALVEVRRVLKPGGRLLFCEHGRSHVASVARWQDRLTPLWRRIAGGCHLNRDIAAALKRTGFGLEQLENYDLRYVPSIIGYHYLGSARPR